MKPRSSIKWLLAVAGLSGIALAALGSATDWWASGIFTATLLAFALAAPYAAYRRGARRAFWSAFVAFGAGYLLLAFCPGCETSIRPRLLTTRLLGALSAIVHPASGRSVRLGNAADAEPPPAVAVPHRGGTEEGTTQMTGTSMPVRRHFQDIGHSLIALLLATIGGTASRYFYGNRDERRREAAEKAAGVLLRIIEAGL
jgi:hypothetical protein